ncbi:MAG: glycosyltransferase [Nocardioidaceae bacterium]
MRVAIVHDYLTQRGGAERVALALLRAFPNARLLTSVYNPEGTFAEFRNYDVETLWLNRFRIFRRDPRLALPLLPNAFSGAFVGGVDLVICSSSGWSHGVLTDAPKLVYCHNPARWLYQTSDYLRSVPAALRPAVRGLLPYLLRWDQAASRSVGQYVANSTVVRDRVWRTYGRPADVVHPPIGVQCRSPSVAVPGIEPGFLLTVSRLRAYKNVRQVCEAVATLPSERLVVVGGLPERARGSWPAHVVGLTDVPDEQMRWLYANCAGLVAVGHEDFGLTPVEAYSFGKPAIVLRGGGYIDTSIDGLTGVFVEAATTEQMQTGIRRLRAATFDPCTLRDHAARYTQQAFASAMYSEAARLLALRAPARSLPSTSLHSSVSGSRDDECAKLR